MGIVADQIDQEFGGFVAMVQFDKGEIGFPPVRKAAIQGGEMLQIDGSEIFPSRRQRNGGPDAGPFRWIELLYDPLQVTGRIPGGNTTRDGCQPEDINLGIIKRQNNREGIPNPGIDVDNQLAGG
ncbi:MAG: hypothetical protein U0903_20290 [Planctomycetales bacterium]